MHHTAIETSDKISIATCTTLLLKQVIKYQLLHAPNCCRNKWENSNCYMHHTAI